MTRRIGSWRWFAVALAMVLAIGAPASASAGTKDGNHCVFGDFDFNAAFGVTEALVWACNTEVGSGQDWRTNMAWGMDDTFVYKPKGFVPAGDTPLEDFLAKFAGVRIVVDPGTSGERTYVFTDTSRIVVVNDTVTHSFDMGVMDPLPVGPHYLESYWTMSGVHCDGFPKPKGGCLPAGDSLGFATEFTVTAGN